MDTFWNQIQGKSLLISKLMFDANNKLLEMHVTLEGKKMFMKFINVSQLKISNLFSEFLIAGFELIDQINNGWQPENRYYVHDFEQDTISFYCESISGIEI